MGSDKAGLLLDGKMMSEIAVENLQQGGVSQIVVSVRDSNQSEWIKNIFGNDVETVIDSNEQHGIWDVLKASLPNDDLVQIIQSSCFFYKRERIFKIEMDKRKADFGNCYKKIIF